MPFIGNTPAQVPLTSADIADGIITSAKIVDGTIVNADINASAGLVLTKLASTGTLTVDNIQFPATAVASANANNLDDYEEGTFTPTVAGTTTAGTASYTTQLGRYTKIGNMVYFNVYLIYSSGNGTGSLKINGLPFTSNSTANNLRPITTYVDSITLSASNFATAYISNNVTSISFSQSPVGGGGGAGVSYDGTGEMLLSGQYEI
jgi:hypothetical protein